MIFRDISRWDTYQPFDPVPPVGDSIMEESFILCLDEFQVRVDLQNAICSNSHPSFMFTMVYNGLSQPDGSNGRAQKSAIWNLKMSAQILKLSRKFILGDRY